MIDPDLYRELKPLDRREHRALRMQPLTDFSVASALHGMFVTVVEFADACKEFAIVFARIGQRPDGQSDVAPMAVLGFERGENLFLDGPRWTARYKPAFLVRYPFAMTRVDDNNSAVCIDRGWSGWSEGGTAGEDDAAGRALFDANGEATPFLEEARRFCENFEREAERTRRFGALLLELGLLQDKRFEATLPSGEKLTFDGFLAIDEAKLAALPDAEVLQLHRSGMLGMMSLQMMSLGNLQQLVQRRVDARGPSRAASDAPANTSANTTA